MPSFDKELRYPARCEVLSSGGGAWNLSDYVEWMLPCTVVSLANLPAISVPVGTARDGTPIGVQLVGRQGGEAALLAAAALLETAVDASAACPRVPITPALDAAPQVGHQPGPNEDWRWTGPRSADQALAHLAKAPKILH